MHVRFFRDVREMLLPRPGSTHGPLAPLLVGLTFVTGLVDAFSYLVLGHVFVANMTGNVVFLGFAFAGAPGFSIPASLVALGAFVAGALIGGRLGSELGLHRGRLLAGTSSLQVVFLGASLAVAGVSGDPVTGGYRYTLIVLLSVSMGIQNAAARKLAVPDLTTSVLTMTITGAAADSELAGGAGSSAGRRLVAVAAILLGALVGAVLALDVHIVGPLAIALIVTAVVAVVSWRAGAADPPWVHPR